MYRHIQQQFITFLGYICLFIKNAVPSLNQSQQLLALLLLGDRYGKINF